jgi:2-polyprenyl-6-methoxyphenol hydroxylase-like FAD-dependent oxidoreductase
MAQHRRKAGQEAIVIGGSMAGLLAARALAESYELVSILERDALPAGAENRKGVPQGRHAHALLSSGHRLLEEFFPALTHELVGQGALVGDATGQAVRVIGGWRQLRFNSGRQGLYVSRPLLEAAVRARVKALPNVRIVDGCDVVGLTTTPDHGRVTGVRLLRRRPGSADETLAADLVVDASGRGSRTPAWLEALGYARPVEEQVRVDVGYVSRIYRRRPEHARGALAVNITSQPPNRRAGVMLAMEADRWMATLVGYLGDHPPADPQAFADFARGLPARDIYDIIRTAEPLSDPVPAKYPASVRRRYDRLDRFPAGLLVVGDALSTFNPTYGQGMSVAAMHATALRDVLEQGGQDLARSFFRTTARIINTPWRLAVGGDLRFAEVEGQRNPMQLLINRYLDRFHQAAQHDPELVSAFGKVVSLLAPPASLLQPRLVWRVLRGNARLAWRQGRASIRPTTPRSQPYGPENQME